MRRPRPFGPYLLLYRVASGGMAELYRARQYVGGEAREVALKRPLPVYNDDEEFIVMLTDEARITALFDHPNITRTLEFGVVDGQYFLAMEYVPGVDLRAIIRRAGERREALPATTAAWIVERALRGLHHAHEARDDDGRPLKLVHRDFSPSNILVGEDGSVKLTDFGIAKARFNKARTRAGFIKGKVRYMSPEQTRSAALDRRSDVFAAGVVLYFAVTGRLPFRGDDDNRVMDAVRRAAAHPPSAVRPEGLDGAFDAVVARALAKDPDDRFPTAAAFADALADWRRAQGAGDGRAAAAARVRQMFAQELAEAEALYRSFDDRALSDRTPTGSGATYTRLVGQDGDDTPVDGGADASESELLDEIDAWLAARRGGDEPRGPSGAGDAWTGDHDPPTWVAASGEPRSEPARDTAPGVPAALGDRPITDSVPSTDGLARGEALADPMEITGSTVDESFGSGQLDSVEE